jgi:hypothetical protein
MIEWTQFAEIGKDDKRVYLSVEDSWAYAQHLPSYGESAKPFAEVTPLLETLVNHHGWKVETYLPDGRIYLSRKIRLERVELHYRENSWRWKGVRDASPRELSEVFTLSSPDDKPTLDRVTRSLESKGWHAVGVVYTSSVPLSPTWRATFVRNETP